MAASHGDLMSGDAGHVGQKFNVELKILKYGEILSNFIDRLST